MVEGNFEEKAFNSNILTEKEKKHLKLILNFHRKSNLVFFAAGVCFTVALLGLVLGLVTTKTDGFVMALYFGSISSFIIIFTKREKKLLEIFRKLIRESELN
jgi:hypothetical protein